MAVLVSPGVNVSVVDESAYGAPGAGTVPLMVVATRQDKSDPTGSEADGLAKFTKSAQAGKVVKVTSQRELTQYFGNPTFTKSGTTIVQGSETSEYGLMAAYSYLGQGSQAFIVRADLSLGQLEASTTTPTATYATNGGLWLDTDASKYGIHEWSATNNSWENKIPTVEINATGTQATIDGDTGHTPATAASAATNDTYLVVLHVDNETATTTARQISLQYFHGAGGAWELIDNSLAAGTATYDEHYSAPSSPSAGDIWIKTTSPGNGLDLKLYEYNTSSTSFVLQTVQGISTTQADGAGAITDFVPQNGSSTVALTTSTAIVGNYLADQQANTKATIVVREITTGGAVGAITSGDVLAQTSTPTATAATGQYWFDNTINSLDVYRVNAGAYDAKTATYSTTAPTGPSAEDIWVDTTLAAENQANERAYPKIYQRNAANDAWVLHSNSDQTTSNGVLFADIDDTAGGGAPITGRPSPAVYPTGMVVINMAQSKNTVRAWNGTAWRNGVSNHADGSGRFGRYAQRGVIATKMQAAITGSDLRDPQYKYSLIASPNYPELVDEMVTLNSDRGETAFIVIDSPMRKGPTSIISWTNNSASAAENGEDGLVTKNTYSAVYYPSGQTTEPVNGETVTVPASHMALYTIAYNDNISFQWFAPAGTTRGVVQNASAVGFLTTEGEFKAISLTQGQRDAMYTAKINPITTFPGQGTIVFGQKTLHATTSSLDRVNVARLVAYLRERFDEIARPFLFEINDAQTRARAKVVFERFLADILSRRGLNDFAVVCDDTNNTPARIDRNEFYVDVAIEPAKAAEFIYIPIRLVNTGTLNSTN
tara:strand:+ start:291 stop:2777 length:2487 start_codon:yes stop_codon:yes gene_type:complete